MDKIRITCTPVQKLFPFNPEDEADYCLVRYQVCEDPDNPQSQLDQKNQFTAAGMLLPYGTGILVTLEGSWTEADGEQRFQVERSAVHQPKGFLSLSNYLQTFPYLNKRNVSELINDFGIDVLKRLDSDPSLICRYVSKKHEERALLEYELRRVKRDLYCYLVRRRVSRPAAVKLIRGIPSLPYFLTHPFEPAIQGDMSFQTAASIAKEQGLTCEGKSAMMASIVNILKQSEGRVSGKAFKNETIGNTCLPVDVLLSKAAAQIGVDEQASVCRQALEQLLKDGICTLKERGFVYRTVTAAAEYGIAEELLRLINMPIQARDFKNEIARLELKGRVRLAPEQRAAVKMALNHAVTLLIGGPGTGKTTIERFIISLYKKIHPERKILLLAPTGKAACRMKDSTGEKAYTVHKALGVVAGEEVLRSDRLLDAGLILVDESSMLGNQEAWALLKAVRTGTQVVFVGDTNQLPSVGAGNVLAEMIRSGILPIAQLITVYRQKAGSTIAINCARIKAGKTALEEDSSFKIIEVQTQKDAVQEIIHQMDLELAEGLQMSDLCVLSPYRKYTPTGIDQLNPIIQKKVRCRGESITYGKKIFYLHDRVMYLANKEDAANGDVGTICRVDGNKFEVDYGDGRVIRYRRADLRDFDLSYCITIHKSQGDEYHVCIIVLMNEHTPMLKRNLIYTAVSRAKHRVVIIGRREALKKAVLTEDASVRRSRLAEIMIQLHNEKAPA